MDNSNADRGFDEPSEKVFGKEIPQPDVQQVSDASLPIVVATQAISQYETRRRILHDDQTEEGYITLPDSALPAIHSGYTVSTPPIATGSLIARLTNAIIRIFVPIHGEVRHHRFAVIRFGANLHNFQFNEPRERIGNWLIKTAQPAPKTPIPRVQPPPPPPEMRTATLAELLRWILTPPINQLISDLTIPEKPFPFQVQGIQWLKDRDHALLADEMGLGKTMQAILAARLLWRDRKIENVFVICPKSLVGNWKREFGKWWPDGLAHLIESGPDRRFFLKMATSNVVVKLVNYESLARERDWLEQNQIQHDLVIIDEAQRIKTPGSKTAIAVKCLRGKRCWALTGTPLENRVEVLISIMDFVHPGLHLVDDVRSLRRSAGPYILRRRLDDPDIGIQLPEMIAQDVEVELTDIQRANYDRLEQQGIIALNSQGETVTIQHIFALIQKLVQVCNFDPESGESGKCERLLEDFEEVAESDKKALVFSRFVSETFGLKMLSQRLQAKAHRVLELHGDIPSRNRDQIIERFSRSPIERALLLNYSVGAVGLNLQAAGYVFLFDRWWNPAVEDQAVKRAHRIGQKERVIVRRFFCKGTIEEKILAALQKKRRLFREVIDEDRPHEAMGLSQDEWFSLFDLKVRPRPAASVSSLRQISVANMLPYDFEALIADLYRAQGFEVNHTGGRGDGGIDVLAERKTSSGIERIAIQCKHISNPVGPEILRSLWGTVNNDHSLTLGVLATTSTFSRDARAFAEPKRLHLIDRAKLSELLKQYAIAEILD